MNPANYQIVVGDCLEKLKELTDNSVDAIVTDPPAGIAFLGKSWDEDKGGRNQWVAWMEAIARECFRVLKPGGHALVWGLPRTSHWTAWAWESAGWEVRDMIAHIQAQGFPKSLDVSKGIGKTKATEDAKKWKGFGTGLKPSAEPWWLFRKPLVGSVVENVLEHGTGALNIDGCRIQPSSNEPDSGAMYYRNRGLPMPQNKQNYFGGKDGVVECDPIAGGRWPANCSLEHTVDCRLVGTKVIHGSGSRPSHIGTGSGETSGTFGQASSVVTTAYSDENGMETVESWECVDGCAVKELDRQSGFQKSGVTGKRGACNGYEGGWGAPDEAWGGYYDNGGASRFFFTAKSSKNERTAGGKVKNKHPTVKPVSLMRYLCRLITPPGGLVLDPFTGSGTTGVAALQEGFQFLGFELEKDSAKTANGRCALALEPGLWTDPVETKEPEPEPEVTLESILGF